MRTKQMPGDASEMSEHPHELSFAVCEATHLTVGRATDLIVFAV